MLCQEVITQNRVDFNIKAETSLSAFTLYSVILQKIPSHIVVNQQKLHICRLLIVKLLCSEFYLVLDKQKSIALLT